MIDIIKEKLVNAEWALSLRLEKTRRDFESIEDDYIRERIKDIAHVVLRVQRVLTGRRSASSLLEAEGLDETIILVADQLDPADMLLLRGRDDLDIAGIILEALQYARQLQEQKQLMKLVGKSRQIVISDVNLPLLGKQFSYADYAEFYEKNFAPLKIATEDLLDIPEEPVVEPDEQSTTKQRDDFEEEPADNQNTTNTFFDEEPQPAEEPSTEGGVVNIEDEQPQESATETVVKEEPKPEVKEESATTAVEEPKPEVKEESATTVVEEPKPEVKEEPKPIVKEEPKQLEDDFYFGEDPQPKQSTSNKKQNSKQTESYDDDEYYDLDGF
jgi:hypothetical protein